MYRKSFRASQKISTTGLISYHLLATKYRLLDRYLVCTSSTKVESNTNKRLESRRGEIPSQHVDLTVSCSSRPYKFKMHSHLCERREEVGQQSPYSLSDFCGGNVHFIPSYFPPRRGNQKDL